MPRVFYSPCKPMYMLSLSSIRRPHTPTLLRILHPPLQDMPRPPNRQTPQPKLPKHLPRPLLPLKHPPTNLPQPHPALPLHRQRKQPRPLEEDSQRIGPPADVAFHHRGHGLEVARELRGAQGRELVPREDGGPEDVLQAVEGRAGGAAEGGRADCAAEEVEVPVDDLGVR